tara:strand:+ start:7527 stop:11051 length:3525 start_codon:yes stop_codon:yes gene_type:complete
MPPRRVQKLAFPVKGINENFGYEDQPPGTTPDAENVRPHTYGVDSKGRMRGGSRPGLSPHIKDYLGAELKFREEFDGDGKEAKLPIQNIIQIPSTEFDEHLGDGRVFHAGLTNVPPAAIISENASANSSQLNAGTATTNEHDALADRTYCCSAWDSAGNCYVAAVKEKNDGSVHWTNNNNLHGGSFDVEVYKFDRAGNRTSFVGGYEGDSSKARSIPCRTHRAGRQVLGIAIYNSIIYLWIRNVSVDIAGESTFSGSFIFRMKTDGTMVDGFKGVHPKAWADSHSEGSVTATDGQGLLDGCAGPLGDIWITNSLPDDNATADVYSEVNNLLYVSGEVLYVLTTGKRTIDEVAVEGAWVFVLDIHTQTRIQAHIVHSVPAEDDPPEYGVVLKWSIPAVEVSGTKEEGVTSPDSRYVYDIAGDGGAKVWVVTGEHVRDENTDRVSLYEPGSARSVPESSLDGATSARYLGENELADGGRGRRIRSLTYDPINGLLLICGYQVCGKVSGGIAALDPGTLDVVQYQIGTVANVQSGSGISPSSISDIGILYGSYGFDQAPPTYPILLKIGSEVVRASELLTTGDGIGQSDAANRDATFDCSEDRGNCGTSASSHTAGDPIYRMVNMGPENNVLSSIRATGYDIREDYPGTTFVVGKNTATNTFRLLSNFNIVTDGSNKVSQEGLNALGLGKDNKILGSEAGYTHTGSLVNAIDDGLSVACATSTHFVRQDTLTPGSGTRSLQLLAVCGGEIALVEKDRFSNRDTSIGIRASVLSLDSRFVDSAHFGGNAYFCDGFDYVAWFGLGQFPLPWAATIGSLPKDRLGRAAKLATTWRGRIVLSGVTSEPRNWFMSSLGDPLNWDYFPDVSLETQAVAGNNSDAGLSGDIVNALIPYSDDLILFGGDQTIWQMTGDPMSGGRLDLVADITGVAFGDAWCKDPFGQIYFFGSKGGVFKMVPNQKPEMLSHTAIFEALHEVDIDNTRIRLAWNNREMGVHVFMTPLNLSKAGVKHFFYDVRTESWWRDSFAESKHNPTAIAEIDGFLSDDRSILLGTQDGGILKWDRDATSDNGTSIASHVLVGPIRAGTPAAAVRLEELEGTLASGAGTITYEVLKGSSPELAATADTALFSGTMTGSTRMVDRRRATGKDLYLKLSSTSPSWAMESFSCLVSELPRASSRRFR